jgi:N-acetylglucosaminyldiphosphoundecaprenol N-acetyl-beta-D-mannosaminyltransferase
MPSQTKFALSSNYEITINSLSELLFLTEEAWAEQKAFRVVTFNPEMLVQAESDDLFKKSIVSAQALIPDGIGLVALLRKKGCKQVQRQPGIELAWKLLNKAVQKNLPIALIGSSPESLAGTIQRIHAELGEPKIVYSRDGFFSVAEEELLVTELLATKPALLLVAMPFVRQEPFLHKLQERGLKAVSIGVGGSFDVWAGVVERAPKWLQGLNLEWTWRIIKQPQRISRLLKMLPSFLKIYFSV